MSMATRDEHGEAHLVRVAVHPVPTESRPSVFDENSLVIPPRRNVKAITEALADLATGDIVRATFVGARYGAVAISGSAAHSASVKAFHLAGLPIESALKPDKAIQSLEVTLRASTHWDAEPSEAIPPAPAELADGLADLVATISHGDLVEAVFSTSAYGEFTIAGAAVWSEVGEQLLVGSWILSTEGVPAPALLVARVIAAAGSHSIGVPARITAVGEDVE